MKEAFILTELINTHCHTGFCGHAEGSVDAYVAAAREAGLTTLAFTDHYPLSDEFDFDGYLSVPPDKLPAYIEAVREAQDRHDDLEIILGCELDYLGDDEDRPLTPEDLSPYRLILGSVHFVDRWAFDDPDKRDRWEDPGMPDATWRRYFELWCTAVSDPSLPYHVMSHPDLVKKFNYYPTFDPSPLYRQAAEAAAASGRMIEVNTSGSYYACKEIFPTLPLLEMFCRAGVPCTVGTDAHVPANVARDIERGYDLMRKAGYRAITVPTADGDRREVPL